MLDLVRIMSDKDESLEVFGNLLDSAGDIIENIYGPDEPEDMDEEIADIPLYRN